MHLWFDQEVKFLSDGSTLHLPRGSEMVTDISVDEDTLGAAYLSLDYRHYVQVTSRMLVHYSWSTPEIPSLNQITYDSVRLTLTEQRLRELHQKLGAYLATLDLVHEAEAVKAAAPPVTVQ